MIEYKEITIEDKDWASEKLHCCGFRGSEYCFANQFLWGRLLNMKIAVVENMLCTLYEEKDKKRTHDFPVGKGDVLLAVRAIMEDDQKCQKTTVFRGVFKEKRELLEQEFPGMFEFKEKRSEWDYLYSANLLATLPGKKFHGKRNHIARFQDGDNWSYEAITQENIPACLEMYHI